MAQTIDPALVLQYHDQVMHLFQQRFQRLRQHVQVHTGVTGTMDSFDLLGSGNMQDITGERDADTEWQDAESTRRWSVKNDFNYPILIGRNDKLEMLIDLERGYAQNGAMAAARKADELIIDAMTATAATGQTGTGTSTYSTSVPTAGGGGGNEIASGSVGLTVDKVRQARETLSAREAGVDDLEAGDTNAFVMVVSARQMRDLMEETEATSSDFISDHGARMPLVHGMIPFYMGFRLRISSQLNTNGSSERQVLCWHRDAAGASIWAEPELSIDRIPTKNNATGIQYQLNMGAVRVQDEGMLSIACTE